MIYRLLGELEIGEGSRLLHLPGGPTLVVLAALLVNANRRMSKTELIRVAWGGDGVEEAQLYKRVKAVRDLLAEMDYRPPSSPSRRRFRVRAGVTLIGRRRQPLTGSEKAGNGSREISCRGGRTLAGRQ